MSPPGVDTLGVFLAATRISLTSSSQNKAPADLYNAKEISEEKYTLEQGAGFCVEKKETRAKNRFKGKTIIVTGAAGNFGGACARRFASEGAKVALWDIKDSGEVAKELNEKYGKDTAKSYVADVTNEKLVNQRTDEVVKDFGRIDYLFNNAGYQGDFKPTDKYGVADFRKILDINVTGVFIVLKAVANAMKAQKPQGGAILNTASMAGHGLGFSFSHLAFPCGWIGKKGGTRGEN